MDNERPVFCSCDCQVHSLNIFLIQKLLGVAMQVRFNSVQVSTFLMLSGILSLIAGCSGNSNMQAVSGTIKAKGKVVTSGEVMFYPQGGGRPSVGIIGNDGGYELTSKKKGDGVAIGSYDVTITAIKEKARRASAANSVEEETAADMLLQDERVTWVFPMKFSERRTSPLTAEVKAGEPNVIDFDSADF